MDVSEDSDLGSSEEMTITTTTTTITTASAPYSRGSCQTTILLPEILAEVFALCVRNSGINVFTNTYSNAPFVFTRVCSRWRYIALTTSHLWARFFLSISGPGFTKSKLEEGFNILKLCVARSSVSLLSFRLFIGRGFRHRIGEGDDVMRLYGLQILEYLMLFKDRWYDVDVTIADLDEQTALERLSRPTCPV